MKAFTLIEILLVIVIVGVISALAAPALLSLEAGQSLTRAGSIITDQIALARQSAITRNRNIEVRLVTLNDNGTAAIRGVQLWIESQDGSTLTPLNRMEVLPSGIAISGNPQLSPLLLADPTRSGTATFSGHGITGYNAFQIRPSSWLSSAISSSNNFLTLYNLRDSGIPPKNFFTLRVNPVTSKVTQYRP